MKQIGILVLGLIVLTFWGCNKQPPPENPQDNFVAGQSIFILNEGNFQQGNASITHFDLIEREAGQKVFENANKRPVGDVLQSATMIDGDLYLVVNNSGKIEIVDPANMKSKGIINGFVSPRYIVQVSPDKAYVSDLYANEITIVDLKSNQKTGSIKLKGWTEQMLALNDKIWVTNYTSKFLFVIDAVNDKVLDSVEVGIGGQSLVSDKNGKLWVLSRGDTLVGEAGRLTKIDPDNTAIEQSWTFPFSSSPFRLQINKEKDRLYYLDKSVFSMKIIASQLPASPLISANRRNFYGMAIDQRNNAVYVSDARDFVQNGLSYRYSVQGALLDSLKTGIIPGDFFFY
jgi:YVTN family beta-propeller protein